MHSALLSAVKLYLFEPQIISHYSNGDLHYTLHLCRILLKLWLWIKAVLIISQKPLTVMNEVRQAT